MNRAAIVSFVVGVAVIAFAAEPAQAVLIHRYRLAGSFADDLGGPSLIPAGGVLSATGYSFGPNEGLALIGALPNVAHYSIELLFQFATVTSWRKIIDFSDLEEDPGLYNYSTGLQLYPHSAGASGAIPSGKEVRLVLTRDMATDRVTGYVDGTQQFSVIDSTRQAVFGTTINVVHFFKDDVVTLESEASSGIVRLIRLYDRPLTAAEVAAIPEPGTIALCLSGLIACAAFGRGFRRGSRRAHEAALSPVS
jgi:hypothetical protein